MVEMNGKPLKVGQDARGLGHSLTSLCFCAALGPHSCEKLLREGPPFLFVNGVRSVDTRILQKITRKNGQLVRRTPPPATVVPELVSGTQWLIAWPTDRGARKLQERTLLLLQGP